MEHLNKNKYGQFDDNRAIEIREDFEKTLLLLLEKWDDVDSMDIESIIFHSVPYIMVKRSLRLVNKIK